MILSDKKCIPCQGGVPPLAFEEVEKLKGQISADWELTHDGRRLLRKEKYKDFSTPMKLAVEIGKMADQQWHHPEINLGFGHLEIEVWTHKINGLVESDFIFAAKVDAILKENQD